MMCHQRCRPLGCQWSVRQPVWNTIVTRLDKPWTVACSALGIPTGLPVIVEAGCTSNVEMHGMSLESSRLRPNGRLKVCCVRKTATLRSPTWPHLYRGFVT
uniref:(northern house mosquito) hypothetical protein n=1 Tax=Culex pipiens TaxID=7175 RepID=A0A8D8AQD3_CULPI